VIDPGRTFPDGSPVTVTDPMYGVWCAAAANPGWMLSMFQGHGSVDVVYDRAGYDGSGFNPYIATPAEVDQSLYDLLTQRGLDRASAQALSMAGSVADAWASLNGQPGQILPDLRAVLGSLERDERLKTWWDKWGHLTLESISLVLGVAAIIVPGPGWISGGLLVGSFGVGTADAVMYAEEGDWWTAGLEEILLLPVGIGGIVKLIPVSRAALDALRAGLTVAGPDAAGQAGFFVPTVMDDGTVTVTWITSVDVATGIDADTLAAYLAWTTGSQAMADDFLATGVWPDGVQVPRGPWVLDPGLPTVVDWPPAGGFVTDAAGNPISQPFVPSIGEVFDRYGPPDGRFTSPLVDGAPVPYGERSLPYVEDPAQYHTYEVTGDLSNIEYYYDQAPANVQTHVDDIMEQFGLSWGDLSTAYEGRTAAWFGESGGGVQVQWPLGIDMLVDLGILAEVG